MRPRLRRAFLYVLREGLFGVAILACFVLVCCWSGGGCQGVDDVDAAEHVRACDGVMRPRPPHWIDCQVRAVHHGSAPALGCPPAAVDAYSVQGRAADFQRVAALVCCSGPSCEVARVWSAEPTQQAASYESARSHARKDGVL